MDVEDYFRSLSLELEAQKNRVRNFISDKHWLTDGEWKESVLRSVLATRLPDTVRIGRGFILSPDGVSTQCDILLYKASSPVLFRDGDLVILPPDAVLGVLEVKTRLNKRTLMESAEKLAATGRFIGRKLLLGLFSYESDIDNGQTALTILQQECDHWTNRIDILCLGPATFVKWWACPPLETLTSGADTVRQYEKWHLYRMDNMAAGYFLTNVIDIVCPKWLWFNNGLWFPETGKEKYKTGEIEFRENPIEPTSD